VPAPCRPTHHAPCRPSYGCQGNRSRLPFRSRGSFQFHPRAQKPHCHSEARSASSTVLLSYGVYAKNPPLWGLSKVLIPDSGVQNVQSRVRSGERVVQTQDSLEQVRRCHFGTRS